MLTKLLFFFISCFTVLVMPSINALESSNNFLILITSFISSFKINKVDLFPGLAAPLPLIFHSNLFIAFETKLLTNPGKSSLAKGLARSVSAFFLNYLTKNQKIHLIEWIILLIWVLLSFISFGILLAKGFLILVVCLVRNSSCGNCSSSKVFLFILNIVPVLFLL